MSSSIVVLCNNPANRISYTAFLQGYGYIVSTVETLTEAQDLITQQAANLLVIDMKFADSQLEALIEQLPIVPPIIVVGSTALPQIHCALQRPVDLDQLLEAVQHCLV